MVKRFRLAITLVASLLILPCSAQENDSATRVQIKRMEIPKYLPLAKQAGVSGSVTLHLTVGKDGKVVSVNVVTTQPKDWGKGFAEMAIEAAKRSEFVCSACSGDTFTHTVTYQFRFPARSEDVCTTNPPIPASTVDSASHVTVRPDSWACVQP